MAATGTSAASSRRGTVHMARTAEVVWLPKAHDGRHGRERHAHRPSVHPALIPRPQPFARVRHSSPTPLTCSYERWRTLANASIQPSKLAMRVSIPSSVRDGRGLPSRIDWRRPLADGGSAVPTGAGLRRPPLLPLPDQDVDDPQDREVLLGRVGGDGASRLAKVLWIGVEVLVPERPPASLSTITKREAEVVVVDREEAWPLAASSLLVLIPSSSVDHVEAASRASRWRREPPYVSTDMTLSFGQPARGGLGPKQTPASLRAPGRYRAHLLVLLYRCPSPALRG